MTPPLVSILIPAYRAAPWIAQTLDSALAQTHPRCEIIVVDDGSPDATLAIACAHAARHPGRIHVATQTNSGASAARNHALRLASGDFIQFLDADDLLAPDKIECQLAALRDAHPLALVFGSWGRFSLDPSTTTWPNEAVAQARNGIEFLLLHYETGSMMQPGSWLAPRALLDLAGPWDESLSLNDDGEYFARVMLRAAALVSVPSARSYYRITAANSLSRRRDARALESLSRSVALTIGHLLSCDASPRAKAAANLAWRSLAFELYPQASALAGKARASALALGGPDTPRGGPPWIAGVAHYLGWPAARRLHLLRNQLPL